ncbi:Uncharacterized protein APZ42_024130 [Daphnia magna]|uniref:Uncharacterized protein n=1 Tax=Daphnia magna TaxID=35525 RepID=A0A164UH50_9CRUS|nr:Uncharacterized protein APZ42_024130 [Daphnia magna]
MPCVRNKSNTGRRRSRKEGCCEVFRVVLLDNRRTKVQYLLKYVEYADPEWTDWANCSNCKSLVKEYLRNKRAAAVNEAERKSSQSEVEPDGDASLYCDALLSSEFSLSDVADPVECTGPPAEESGLSTEEPSPSTEEPSPSAEEQGPSAEEQGPSAEEQGPSAEEQGPSAKEPGPPDMDSTPLATGEVGQRTGTAVLSTRLSSSEASSGTIGGYGTTVHLSSNRR